MRAGAPEVALAVRGTRYVVSLASPMAQRAARGRRRVVRRRALDAGAAAAAPAAPPPPAVLPATPPAAPPPAAARAPPPPAAAPAAALAASSDLAAWVGAAVVVQGLEKQAQYNGRRATVLKVAGSHAGRLEVRLVEIKPEDGDGLKRGLKMALHPVNLRRV